jgi:hypothetical protein
VRRVLITGSRDWENWDTIYDALTKLKEAIGEFVVVHGGARGADSMAGIWAQRTRTPYEIHRPDWSLHGKKAGFIRNNEMVKAGADMCLAFIRDESDGATGCATLAEAAGIPVKYFRETSDDDDS